MSTHTTPRYGGKFQITLPDGTVAKRTSKSMTYTHAIVRVTSYRSVRWSLAQSVERYTDLARQYEVEGKADAALRFRGYAERDQAQLDSTPTEGCEYAVISWSQSAAGAAKRARADRGERVMPVD